MNSKESREELLRFTQDIAFDAGEILLKCQSNRHDLKIIDKGREGIASEADKLSEDFLLSSIKEKYPQHKILSEEDYATSKESSYQFAKSAEFCWVIDPLDGTNNFVNGIPIYAISLCLLKNGEPLMGLVYNPLSGECFFALKDEGAHLIDFRVNPLKRHHLKSQGNYKKMSDCIFSPAPVYNSLNRFEVQLSTFKKNIVGARAVRRLGSAALEICYVACGNFDAYWEQDLKPWDVAAAYLICRESGICVTDYDGQEFSPFKDSVIAAASPLHAQILGKIS